MCVRDRCSRFTTPHPTPQVCGALRKIADMGICVALVLHQPRYEIFSRFDDVRRGHMRQARGFVHAACSHPFNCSSSCLGRVVERSSWALFPRPSRKCTSLCHCSDVG